MGEKIIENLRSIMSGMVATNVSSRRGGAAYLGFFHPYPPYPVVWALQALGRTFLETSKLAGPVKQLESKNLA
jgi:hypothetical protein